MADSRHLAARSSLVTLLGAALLLVTTLATAGTIQIKVGNSRRDAVKAYAARFGVSQQAAERWVRQEERAKGVRVIDQFGLPEGTLIDFYKVRNSSEAADRAKFEGRGRLVDAFSYLGKHYREVLFGLLSTKERDDALALLRQARDHGFMIVPAAVDTQATGMVSPSAANQVTAVVIGTEFPYWEDVAPNSDGDADAYDLGGSEVHYQSLPDEQANGIRYFPMVGNNAGYEEQGVLSIAGLTFHGDWYADSPGGPLVNGIPNGLNTPRWSQTGSTSGGAHPYYGGDVAGAVLGMTEVAFENYWYSLAFDRTNPNSLYNYYFQNSHGNLAFQGDRSHVVGWLHSHHVTDRLPYPGNSAFQAGYGCTQPGTPLIRPIAPTPGPYIYRASLSANACTMLFREDVPRPDAPETPTNFQLWAVQPFDGGGTAFNAEASIEAPNGWQFVRDPYDSRRWTVINNGWRYWDGTLSTPAYVNYAPLDNQPWRMSVTHRYGNLLIAQYHTNDTWTSPGGYGQNYGCPPLSAGNADPGDPSTPTANNGGTVFGTTDVYYMNGTTTHDAAPGRMGSDVGNRLKSFCYYVTDHSYIQGTDPYQAAHLNNAAGHPDDIGGSTVSDFRDRPFPYDHDTSDHSNPNMGNVLGSGGTPGHSAGDMRADISLVLADSGIDISGYDKQIFLFPSSVTSETDTGSPIIPHASLGPGASMVTVPSNCGLTLLAHEVGHTLGLVDLYDNNLYDNANNPIPPYYECATVGPYSLMAHGVRVDPWHKMQALQDGPNGSTGSWVTGTPVTVDRPTAQVPMVEGTLQEPVILKLPAHPLAIYATKYGATPPAGFDPGTGPSWAQLRDPSQWSEYFLLENRNKTGSAYFGDQSRTGLYIWHVDERNIGGFQRAEETLTVALEQADGLNELESNRTGNYGNMQSDPFGVSGNTAFTERTGPHSWSHGRPNGNGLNETVVPETPTDSFVRVVDIATSPGATMAAKVYVEPREIWTEGNDLVSSLPIGDAGFPVCAQGQKDVPVLLLTLHNDSVFPNVSTGPVTIKSLKVLESGTSTNDANLAAAKLYEDTNKNGILEPTGGDSLIATTTLNGDYAVWDNLGYQVPHVWGSDTTRNLIVAYDVSEVAETNPTITLGAEITDYTFITPDQPGAVQMKQRFPGDGYNFIDPGTGQPAYRFPFGSAQALVVEHPDTLTVASTSLAPDTALQGDKVPMMALHLSVDHEAAVVNRLTVTQVAPAYPALGSADLGTLQAYLDADGSGDFDATADTLLGAANFANIGGAWTANITGAGVTPLLLSVEANSNPATGAGPKDVFLVLNVQAGATPGRYVRLALADENAVGLVPNPTFSTLPDVVSPDGFAHESLPAVGTRIVDPNLPPTPPPGVDGDAPWAPSGGVVVGPTPDFTFPSGDDPNDSDDPAWDENWDDLTYIVELSQDGFNTISTYTGPFNVDAVDPVHPVTFTWVGLLAGGDWEWRVRSVDLAGAESANSEVHTFRVNYPPNAPVAPFAPSGGALTNDTPTYTWTWDTPPDPDASDPAATLYTFIEVDDDSDFSSPLWAWDPANPMTPSVGLSAQGASSHQPAGVVLVRGTTYYWHAITIDDDGFVADDWSATQTFRVADNLAPNAPVTGFDPANGAETALDHPTLLWDAATDPDDAAGTLHYVVEMDTDDDWTDGINLLAGADTTADGIVQLLVDPYVCVDNTQYFYRIQTVDGYGAVSPWSATQNFWANLVNDPPDAPSSGFYPANGVNLTIQQPALRCDQVNDPDPYDPHWPGGPYLTYRVQLRAGDGNFGAGFAFEYTALGDVDPLTVDIPVTADLTDATHWFWRVRAEDDMGLAGGWSPTQDFWVDTNNQPPTLALVGVNPGVAPQYGTLTTTYTYRVLYTDVENDAPDGVTVEIDGVSLVMGKADSLDNDYTDGVEYTLALSGAHAAMGYGIHNYRFTTQAGTVHYPADGSTVTGPIVGSISQIRLMNAGFVSDVATYEEGQPVNLQVSDPDTNGDPATAESLQATIAVQGGGDSEAVVLFETGLNTGIFRVTVPMLGAAGAANDGTLNVVAGAAGRTLVANYSDPDCGPDCPAADRDDSQVTAQVQDTTAPAVAQGDLIATSAVNGRSINLDWTAYDEAGQVDVADYEVYLETAPFTSVAALTPLAPNSAAGMLTRTLAPVLPDTDYYVAVVPRDEVPNSDETVTGLLVRTAVGDTTPPTISNIQPANGTAAQPAAPISFRLADAQSGVDQSAVELYVNGALIPAGDLVFSGTPASLLVSYTPATAFAYEQVITVRVVASDIDGNALLDETGALSDGYEWTYTIVPAPRYRITGVVTQAGGAGLGAAAVAVYEGASAAPLTTVMTDGNGYYVVPNLLAGTYRVVPAYTEYDFVPAESSVTLTNSDVADQNFAGALRTYTVAGQVLEAGVGKAGVTVTDGTRTVLTDATGAYVLTGVPSGRYTVTATLANYDFRPSSRAVLVEGAAWTGVDFEAIARTFSISGVVRDYDGNRLQGVHVTAGGQGAVTTDAGLYTISGLLAGTYQVTAAKIGYHVEFAGDSDTVTVPPSSTGVDFVGYASFATTFPAGVSLIGVPCYPASSDPLDVFDASQVSAVARWNPSASPAGYVKLPGATTGLDILDVRPGRGFFVKLVDGNFEAHGRPVSTAKPFTLTLGPGWNMVANMFTSAVPFADFVPGLPGSVRPYGYVYDTATGGYLLVSSTAGVNVGRTTVNPWEGMWLRTNGTTATVNVAAPSMSASTAAVGAEALKLGSGGWTIPVTARTEGSLDATTAVGVGPALAGDYELENPPMAPQSVDVYIADATGAYLSQQVRSGSGTRQTWDLAVATDLANAQVSLSLPDLSQVPSSLAVYLTDKETGKRMYARTMSSYSFKSGDSGSRRAFVLEVAPRDAGGLVLSSTSATAKQGAVVVSYSVSRACQATVKITNVAGRVVRLLVEGRSVEAGLNTVAWDLRSASGTPVPAGRYLVQIEGATEDGQRTQAVTTVMVKR